MSEKSTPIMSLGDEELCYIFSFITDIPLKMSLEAVCKRFHFISSTQSNSWKGVHLLDMFVNCEPSGATSMKVMRYLSDCCELTMYDGEHDRIVLSGYKIPLERWPMAIHQLLQRTEVHKLCLHIDDIPNGGLESVKQSFSVIQHNPSQVRLNYLEFHKRSAMLGPNLSHIGAAPFLWALENSHETIETIVLAMEKIVIRDELWDDICAGVKKCLKLKSLVINPSWDMPFVKMTRALVGKPMTHLAISRMINVYGAKSSCSCPMVQSIAAICATSRAEGGLESLSVTLPSEEPTLLNPLAEALDARSREALEELFIHCTAYDAYPHAYIQQLDELPRRYPNLKHLHLDLGNENGKLDEDALFGTNFFDACNETPHVDRKVVITYLDVDDEDEFREDLADLCEGDGITAVFGEEEDDTWAVLTKGHGTIEIRTVEVTEGFEAPPGPW